MERRVVITDCAAITPIGRTRADIVDHLVRAVRGTAEQLPVLKRAGVVDAGALGLHIYLEGQALFGEGILAGMEYRF